MSFLPEFRVTVSHTDGRAVIGVHGELDLATAPALDAALEQLSNPNGRAARQGGPPYDPAWAPQTAAPDALRSLPRHLTIDLTDTTFVDVAGVRAVCRCAEVARALGLQVSIVPGRRQSRRVFELCGAREDLVPEREPPRSHGTPRRRRRL